MKKIYVNEYKNIAHQRQKELIISDEEYFELSIGNTTASEVYNRYEAPIQEDMFINNDIANEYSWYLSEYKEFVESSLPFDFETNSPVNNYNLFGDYLETETVKSWYLILPTIIKADRFKAVFIKKNGEVREINCIFESTLHIQKGVITVFDLEKQDYRSINMKTLEEIVINGVLYTLNTESKKSVA